MNYTLHQLKVFTKVVENLSITKAANELNMTQPAVSIQLKNLQAQFDIPLTEVVGRQLYVTDFGKELYEIANKILGEVEGLNYKSQIYKGILSGKLKIAAVSTGKYIMPHYLAGFLHKYDNIDLQMDVTNRKQVLESLATNQIDFAFLTIKPDDIVVNEEVILPNRLLLIGPSDTKLNEITKKDFKELPLIFREKGSGTRLIMNEYFNKSNIKPRVKFELTSNEAVKQAVMAGLGYSVIPLVSLRNEFKNKEVKVIKGFEQLTHWRLVWLKKKKLSPVAEALVKYLHDNKAIIEKEKFGWIHQQQK